MSSSTSAWSPAPGRYDVQMGQSLVKDLKMRMGTYNAKRALPEKDFYSFRYNFKPESIDPTKPGTIEVQQGKEGTGVRVERPTSQPNEAHEFEGDEKPAKDFECVLIYDPGMGTYTLEKLDSLISLNHKRRVTTRARPSASASPLPQAPEPPSTSRSTFKAPTTEEIEAELLEGLEDADGEPDDEVPTRPLPQEEEEEEEEEDIPIAVKLQKRPAPAPTQLPRPPPPKPKPALPHKPTPAEKPPLALPSQPPPPKPRAPPKPKAKPASNKRVHDDPDVEELEINRPSPAKRARASPPPPPPPVQPTFSLALPTASGPDPLAHQAAFAPPVSPAPPPPAPLADSDDDEWDEVAAPITATMQPLTIVMKEENSDDNDGGDEEDEDEDEGEEFDDIFQAQMEAVEMDEDDGDGLFPPDDLHPVSTGRPISMNALARGVADEDSDDYSSSSESDDD